MRGGFALFAVLCLVTKSFGKTGFGPGEQEWGFVKVRPYANMFWWLYYTTANVTSYYERPLLIWLEGGPGISSTSIGNFDQVGPLDPDGNPRNHTWVKNYNVLFIDNPVGAGFSYVELPSAYAKTTRQIADDLITCMKEFYEQLPKFRDVPTYVLGESYGGKMGVEFALVWDKAQQAGTIKSNLKGVGIGGPWISSTDSVLALAPYLFQTGMVDTKGYKEIEDAAQQTKIMIESGLWLKALELWIYTQDVINNHTYGIDYMNILTPQSYPHKNSLFSFELRLMNGRVKKALGVNVTHHCHLCQTGEIQVNLQEDIMKPITDTVEKLLNETSLKIFVINGNLDWIINTQGTLRWVEKLKWEDIDDWINSPRHPLVGETKKIEGYSKSYGNLGFYWVNRAGHMIPKDNPAAMDIILKDLTSNAERQ